MNPGSLIWEFLSGDPEAHAAIESWRFSAPVTFMTAVELESLAEQRHTLFSGPAQDQTTPSRRSAFADEVAA